MKWLLVVLFLNVQPHGWEVEGAVFNDESACRSFAREINDKRDALNDEAVRLGRLQLEQVIAWCEKK